MCLSEASDLPHTHDLTLTKNSGSNGNQNSKLPLFGHFCCRLAVQSDTMENASCTGELLLLSKGPARPVKGFARLQAFKLDLWDDKTSFENKIQPRRSVDITRDTKLKQCDETDLIIENMEEGQIEQYIFRAHTGSEGVKWYSALKKCIKEHSQWEHVTVDPAMQLAVPGNNKQYYLRQTRLGSLYDQVPILGMSLTHIINFILIYSIFFVIESVENRQSSRPKVQDIFAIPNSVNTSPNLGNFRTRAYSSGRSSSHSTLSNGSINSISSKRSHWPFGGK